MIFSHAKVMRYFKGFKGRKKGYDLGRELMDSESGKIQLSLSVNSKIKDELLINGTDAVGFGCLAGNCKFMSSYPYDSIHTFTGILAAHSHDFELVYEQAEDEIAAINMAVGASYAGSSKHCSHIGKWIYLWKKEWSLAGMIETPVVIYIGQRPGPAVGLPPAPVRKI